MKSTKSSLALLSKKSAICDKLVNTSNLKLLHGLSLKLSKFKIVSVLLPGLDYIFHTSTLYVCICSIW